MQRLVLYGPQLTLNYSYPGVYIVLFTVVFQISKEQCLLALEYSNWDVHKAIKLAKLQLLVQKTPGGPFVDLATCNGALETSQWDLGKAAKWIIAAHQDGDITQVQSLIPSFHSLQLSYIFLCILKKCIFIILWMYFLIIYTYQFWMKLYIYNT